VVLLGARGEGKCHLVARAGEESSKRVSAADVVKAAASAVGGTGGGKERMAQAGGKDPEKLPEAFARARAFLAERLKGG
jgi:alanyl-tRNA synthetase